MQGGYLHRLARVYSDAEGISLATTSNRACSHARLFLRLEEGRSCTIRTYHRVLEWFADHWPADLEWPADIPRPERGGGD